METEGVLLSGFQGACFCPPKFDACGGGDIDIYSCGGGYGAVGGDSSWQHNMEQQSDDILQQDFWAFGDLCPASPYQPTMERLDPSSEYTTFTTGSLSHHMFSSEGESCTAASVTHSCPDISSAEEITTPQLMSSECSGDNSTNSVLKELFPELVESRLPSLCLDDDGSSNGDDNLALATALLDNCCDNVWDGGVEMGNWGIQMPVPVQVFADSRHVEDAFGIRRTYSDGDIPAFGNSDTKVDNMSTVPPPVTLTAATDAKMEDRRAKILRYKKKKTERNFGRKIKYACRKALADSQPRVRGRFAKTEDWRGCTGTAI